MAVQLIDITERSELCIVRILLPSEICTFNLSVPLTLLGHTHLRKF